MESHRQLQFTVALITAPTLALAVGYLTFLLIGDSYEAFTLLTTPILFFGLGVLGYGFLKTRHRARMIGWIVFSLYWATQPGYFWSIDDIINAVFCAGGVYFLFYLAYHEYLSHIRREENVSLRFIAGTAFIAGFFYFLIEKIPELSGGLIKIVADQTAWIMRRFGYDVVAYGIHFNGEVYVPIEFADTSVWIILACTGIQSMMVFVGAIAALSNADATRRWKAFFATVPVIYVLNLVRNVGVIYGIEVLGLSFYVMHHVVGKIGSLVALIILAFYAFSILPELYDNIIGLVDLPKRKGPVEQFFSKKW